MSSHREAPTIAKDPVVDNTDLYAFVDPVDTSKVTFLSNWKKFGPPAGSSRGMKFERIVTFEVSTGSTNAYRSVLSATGSFEIVGASRWDDIGPHLA